MKRRTFTGLHRNQMCEVALDLGACSLIRQLIAAKAIVDKEKSTHNSGVYHERQPQ
jgi:hypothetical protein